MFEVFHRQRVAWNHLDKAGIVHFSNYLRYAEEAEAKLFRELSAGPLGMVWGGDKGGLVWLRLKAEMEYRHPARLDDRLLVHLWVAEKRSRTLILGVRISLREKIVAQGRIRTVAARMTGQGPLVCRIPEEIGSKLEVAPWGLGWPDD